MFTVKNTSKRNVGKGRTIMATINRMPIGNIASVAYLRDFAKVKESRTAMVTNQKVSLSYTRQNLCHSYKANQFF
jgi:hypothetical protein